MLQKILFNPGEPKRRKKKKKATYPRPSGAFVPPTLGEVALYVSTRERKIDPEAFVDHYVSNGWMVGRTKMKDWRAAVRTWERSSFGPAPAAPAVSRAHAEHSARTLAHIEALRREVEEKGFAKMPKLVNGEWV